MTDQPSPDRPRLASAELVARLWDDVRRAAEEPFVSIVPDGEEVEAMVYDPDLAWLNSNGPDGESAGGHLLALLNTMAERHDSLVVETRLLREAMRAEAERMAERAATLHRLLESRIEAIGPAEANP